MILLDMNCSSFKKLILDRSRFGYTPQHRMITSTFPRLFWFRAGLGKTWQCLLFLKTL